MHTRTQLSTALLVGVFALGGCASTAEIDRLQAQIDEVRSTADAAAAEAAAASREAAEARTLAEQAQDDAAAARAMSEETETKIDRMFKKTMYK